MIEKLVRKNILNLKPYTSARDMYSEGILLDANENPYNFKVKGVKFNYLNRYPDPNQINIRKVLAEYLGISYSRIFFGVGSDEIIDLLIRIFCVPGKDEAILLAPTYGMYKVACNINDVKTVPVYLNKDFQINVSAVKKAVNKKIKLIFLCSPNNPTGNLLKKEDVVKICKAANCIVIIDEAYIDFANNGSVLRESGKLENLVILRTISKAWGLAGARLGYCVADKKIIDLLIKVKAPYNISALTREVFLKRIKEVKKKNSYVKKIISERERVKKELLKMKGIEKIFKSDANFLLFKCKEPKAVQAKLVKKGIIIRDRSSEKMLEGCLRLTIGTVYENNLFLKSLKSIL